MEELILIDGNSLLFKAFYATSYTGNYMVNRNGIPTNGVYGFARMVEKIISTNPKYVIVAFDYGKKTFRNELLDTYKATRKETPQELVPQFALAREYLTAHNITWYEIEGYEGDDIIGTLVDFGEKNNLKVSVYTGDKDANQLISSQTTIYRTVKGVTELDIYNEQTLLDKYGLKPDQFRDFLGLMGDSSDNIPGIKGVGEKTALKLLHQYGTIEGLQEHQDEIKGKMGEKIRAGMEDALMSKKVATILRDIPIDVDLEKATYRGYDYETLKSFYEKYDMNSLIKSMTTEAAPKKELKFEIVDHMPEITKDSVIFGAQPEQARAHVFGELVADGDARAVGVEDRGADAGEGRLDVGLEAHADLGVGLGNDPVHVAVADLDFLAVGTEGGTFGGLAPVLVADFEEHHALQGFRSDHVDLGTQTLFRGEVILAGMLGKSLVTHLPRKRPVALGLDISSLRTSSSAEHEAGSKKQSHDALHLYSFLLK